MVYVPLDFGTLGNDDVDDLPADGAGLGIDPIFTPGIIFTTLINSLASDTTKPIASRRNVINPEIIPDTTPIARPNDSAPLWV